LHDPSTQRAISHAIRQGAIKDASQLGEILKIASAIKALDPNVPNIAAIHEANSYGGLEPLKDLAFTLTTDSTPEKKAPVDRARQVYEAVMNPPKVKPVRKPKAMKLPTKGIGKYSVGDVRRIMAEVRDKNPSGTYTRDDYDRDLSLPDDEFLKRMKETGVNEAALDEQVKQLVIKLPDYGPVGAKPQTFDVEFARVAGGKVKLGADPKALGQVLGSSLYGKDKAEVITKELLQNAMDAIRKSKGEKEVTVEFNRWDHTITITDTGQGMTRKELETVFTDLGASGKRQDVGASGGFGIAKAAPLMMSEKLTVTTITKEKGKLYRHRFESTPEQLLNEGVAITSEELPDGAGYSTGTVIESELNADDANFYQAEEFVTASQRSLRPPGKLVIKGTSYRYSRSDEAVPPKWKKVASQSFPGADIDLYAVPGETRELGSFPVIEVEVNNNGIFQFKTSIYPPEEAQGVAVPKHVSVDIKATVPEGDTDYPFLANRESLRGGKEGQIKQMIIEKMIKEGIEKRRNQVADALANLPSVKVGATDIPIFDSGQRMTKEEIAGLKADPAMIDLAYTIHKLTREAIAALTDNTNLPFNLQNIGKRIRKVGIVFSDAIHGVHITDPQARENTYLFINPFAGINVATPRAASLIWHTIKHELIHDVISGHSENFTSAEAAVSATLGSQHELRAIQELEDVYGDPSDPGRIRPDLSRALQLYAESRERSEVTPDIFGGERLSREVSPGDTAGLRDRGGDTVPEPRIPATAVVGTDGKPLVVYHGTTKDISEMESFDSDMAKSEGKAFFFSHSPTARNPAENANTYAQRGAVVPAYLIVHKLYESGFPAPVPPDNSPPEVFDKWLDGVEKFNRSIDWDKNEYMEGEIAKAKRLGYDGIVFRNIEDDRYDANMVFPTDVYAVFRPEQIKSVFNRGTFDPEDPNILMNVRPGEDIGAPVWYLKSERVIGDKMRGPQDGAAVLKMLQTNGVSPDELKWTGLDDWLPTAGRVTPDQVKEFISQNAIRVDEVHRGAGFGVKTRDEWAQSEYDRPYADLDSAQRRWVDAMTDTGESRANPQEGVPLFNLKRQGRQPMPMPPGTRQRPRRSIVARETLPGAQEYQALRYKNYTELKRMEEERKAAQSELARLHDAVQVSPRMSLDQIRRLGQEEEQINRRLRSIQDYSRQLKNDRDMLSGQVDPNVGEVRLDRDGNPRLYLNKTAMLMISRATAKPDDKVTVHGSHWSIGNARWIKNNLLRMGPNNDDERRVFQPMMRLIDAAITRSRQAGIALIGKMGEGIGSAVGTQREELIHRWQRMRSWDGRHDTHLKTDAFLRLFHALPGAAYDHLRNSNYDDDPARGGVETYVVEAAAKMMAGKREEMGLTVDDAVNWLDRYYNEVTQEHGPDAIIEVGHTVGFARKLQREVERQYGYGPAGSESESGAGTGESSDAGGDVHRLENRRQGVAAGGASPGGAGKQGGAGEFLKDVAPADKTDSPQFKRWFGESKVIDQNGEPLVLYHGTTRKNPKILRQSFEAGLGIFLTDNEDVASQFTLPREYGETVYEDEDGNEIEPGDVVPLYARMENPLVIEGHEAQRVTDDTGHQVRVLEQAKADGHDGVILRDVDEGLGMNTQPGDTYIVFDPKQVKHAERNRGTYDPESANILMSKKETGRGKEGPGPIRAYHGTRAGEFDEFRPNYRRGEQLGFGMHFAADPELGERYATDENTSRRGKKPMVYAVDLDIKKPLKADAIVREVSPEFALAQKLTAGKNFFYPKDEDGTRAVYMQNAIDATSPQRAERLIREAGYDGIEYRAKVISRGGAPGTYRTEAQGKSYVVFDPAQVTIISKGAPGAAAKPEAKPLDFGDKEPEAEKTAEAPLLSDKELEGWSKYLQHRGFGSEPELRDWFHRRLEDDDKQYGGFLHRTRGPEKNRAIADWVPIYRERREYKLGRKPKAEPVSRERLGSATPEGDYPSVDFYRRDLQDSGPVTEESILRDYNYPKKRRAIVYKAYVPLESVPSPVLAEEEEELEDEEDRATYPWEDFGIGRRPFPPAKLLVQPDGKVVISDGNHRIRHWADSGHDTIPAWVIDQRRGVDPDEEPPALMSREKPVHKPPPDDRLVALHNTSAEGIRAADRLGGIPAPSLAIMKPGMRFDDYGQITLVGNREMVDPEKNPYSKLYTSDVYSPRQPRASRKLNEKEANKFEAKVKAAIPEPYRDALGVKWGIRDRFNSYRPSQWDELIRQYKSDAGVQYAYLQSIGKAPALTPQPVRLKHGWLRSPEVAEALKNDPALADSFGRDDKETIGKITDLAKAAVLTEAERDAAKLDTPSMHGPEGDKVRATTKKLLLNGARDWIEKHTDENGLLYHNTFVGIADELRLIAKGDQPDIDRHDAADKVREALKANGGEEAVERFVREGLHNAFGPEYLETGRGNQPYTLESVRRAMIGKGIRGQEDTVTHGLGRARAQAAKMFPGIEAMRKKREMIQSHEEAEAAGNALDKRFFAWRDELEYQYPAQWDSLDALGRAIGRYMKGPKTEQGMRHALAAEDYKTEFASPETLREGMELAKDVAEAPVEYFESKLTNSVSLADFSGAAVPEDTDPEVIDILRRKGLQVEKYGRHDRDDRTKAVQRIKDDAEGKGILFAMGRTPGKTPAGLQGLAAEARKYPTFEEFRQAFSREIKHGTYWHVTDDPNFTIDPAKGPRDMSSMGGGGMSAGRLMITSHLSNWADYYGKSRPYAALIDMSQVAPDAYRQVSRGFGNEFFVDDPSKAKVIKVVPIAQAKQIDRRLHRQLPGSNEKLEEFWRRARADAPKERDPRTTTPEEFLADLKAKQEAIKTRGRLPRPAKMADDPASLSGDVEATMEAARKAAPASNYTEAEHREISDFDTQAQEEYFRLIDAYKERLERERAHGGDEGGLGQGLGGTHGVAAGVSPGAASGTGGPDAEESGADRGGVGGEGDHDSEVQPPVRARESLAGEVEPPALFQREINREAYKKPRDEFAPWHEDMTPEEWSQRSKLQNEWEQSVLAALSEGRLTPREARDKNIRVQPPASEFKPLPEKLYHATTAADAVEEHGLMPRWELEMHSGIGLGGGSDHSISFTTDLETAKIIEQSMKLAQKVAAGETTTQDLIDMAKRGDGAPRPFMTELERGFRVHFATDDPVQAALNEEKAEMNMGYPPRGEGEGWEPDLSAYHWTGGDGKERYIRWKRPMTQKEKDDHRWYAFKGFLFAREQAGGMMDPLFFTTHKEALAKVDPRQIAVLEFKAEPGAMGTQEHALGEWRTYSGRATKLVGRVQGKGAILMD
jgi:hypothetical protein